MKIETYIDALVSYAMNTGLAEPVDHQAATFLIPASWAH